MSGAVDDPGGVRDDEKMAPDAPGMDIDRSPAGMELTFQTPTTEGAVYNDPRVPEPAYEHPYQAPTKQVSFKAPPPETRAAPSDPTPVGGQKQFREQFDTLMKRLEDRFQNERLNLEEKHSRELEEAMGYFSLSSNEREAKQQELQAALLEDIGDMAQQLHELTGALGPDGDAESLTIPSDPRVLEEYARKMQDLEDQFQREKQELERKQASDMEAALGTLKMPRETREAKQLELQDQISAELGDMAKQLEELNKAKEAYESKMGMIKRQLSKEEPTRGRSDPKLQSMNRRLSDVERERDAAQEELRRLKLALQVTHGEGGSLRGRDLPVSTKSLERSIPGAGRLSPQEQNNISGLRGRIEQIEKELKEAAQTPGGSETMRGLRQRMRVVENDLATAEESTKEHFALEHLRARMEKVERLLTEGERAAKDWEALEELRQKIGNVDNDLRAVEEAKKEFEALQALRSKMESVESELKAAEQLATDRENVDRLRQRLGQVERELGVAEPAQQDSTSIDKLLARLAKAESSLQDARESTRTTERQLPLSASRDWQKAERDGEVDKILQRLALAESKLNAAKESAQLRNPNTSSGYPNFPIQAQRAARASPPNNPPFDERQAKIRARLQEHFDESVPSEKNKDTEDKKQQQQQQDPLSKEDEKHVQPTSAQQRVERVMPRSKFEEPRTVGGRNRYYVQDVQLDRDVLPRPATFDEAIPRAATFEDETIPTQDPTHLDDLDTGFSGAADRPLRRRRAGEAAPPPFRTGNEEQTQGADDLVGAATRPLRRRYPGEASAGAEDGIRPSTSMPYSVLGEDSEDRYAANLEELRYQRALLSQKLPKHRMDEEEKKSDDSTNGPKYSWKEAIRNEEKQRMRQRMNPRLQPKKAAKEDPKVPEDPKETVSPPSNLASAAVDSEQEGVSSPPEVVASEPEQQMSQTEPAATADETQSVKTGGDPPMEAGPEGSGDPPSQVPSLEKELKSRLLTQTIASGRDPNPGYGRFRTTLDPPAHIDPPPPPDSVPSTPLVGIAHKEHPSDEKSEQATSAKEQRGLLITEESTFSSEHASFSTPASAPSKPEKRGSKQWWKDSSASKVSEASVETPSSSRPRLEPEEETPRQEPPAQAQPPPPPRPPPPRRPQVPQPPPSPAVEQASRMSQISQISQVSQGTQTSLASRSSRTSSRATSRASSRPPLPPQPKIQQPPPPTPQPQQPQQFLYTQPPLQAPPSPQQPIFHQTTVVDGKAAARERREKDKLMRWVVLILLCIAIILAVVIIVVIVLLRDNNDDRSGDQTPVPTLPLPPSTAAPTVMGSGGNMTMVPTFAPTIGSSVPPTFFSGCPELENNIPLQPDGVTSEESTVGAIYNASVLGSCGNIAQAGDNGVWFALIGEGEVVTVSTCTLFFPSFDTQLLVYTPTNQTQGCRSGLDCVASNDNFCGLQSSVTFIAQDDTLYFIYVNGMTDAPGEGLSPTEGQFSLTVSTSPEGSCQGPLDLEIAPANLLPVIVVGQLIGGTFGVDPCNPEIQSRTGEFWYKVVGTGQAVVATTCHAVSSFEARLAVYQGFCDDLVCITADDDDCGHGSEITWFAQEGMEYLLLVYSPDFVPDVTFGVSVQELL